MSGPVWHRAAATIGADEEVARELDAIAEDAQRRGAIAAAVEALERAAELTGDSDLTAGCLLGAAEWAGGAGRLDVVARLLRAAEPFALVLRAWSEIHIGRWDVAMPRRGRSRPAGAGDRAPIWGGGAKVALSILAGLRGEEDAAGALAVRAEQVGLQLGARAVLSVVQLARGLT